MSNLNFHGRLKKHRHISTNRLKDDKDVCRSSTSWLMVYEVVVIWNAWMERMWSKLGLGQKIRSACKAVCFGMFLESLLQKQLIS